MILGKMATVSANFSVIIAKITGAFVNVFGVVDHAGKTVEPDITVKKKQ